MLIFLHEVSQPVSCSAVGTAHPTGVYILSERVGDLPVLWLFFQTMHVIVSSYPCLSQHKVSWYYSETNRSHRVHVHAANSHLSLLLTLLAITTEPKITVCFKGRVHLFN